MKTYAGLDAALVGELQNIIDFGNLVNSRGESQKEVLCRSFRIKDPTLISIQIPSRKFNADYALFEWLWYISRDRNVHNISKLAKIWDIIKDEDGTVESNYGYYIFDDTQDNTPSPWEWCKQELLDDSDSRRATIPINQPIHKVRNALDIPCTQYIQFFIRDNKLHLSVNMRSCDIIFGMCNDVFTFSLMQQLMLNELRIDMPDLELGYYYHIVGSLHLYERHFKMAKNILIDSTEIWEVVFTSKDWTAANWCKVELKPELTYLDICDSIELKLQTDLDKSLLYQYVCSMRKKLFV